MQLKIDAVTKAPRVFQGKTQWGVKTPDGKWYSLYQTDKPSRGDTIDVDIEESRGTDGKIYYNAYPAPVRQGSPAANGHAPTSDSGKIPWADFALAFKAACALVREAEPDVMDDGSRLDRAEARAKMVDTLMMEFGRGKIEAPEPGPDAQEWPQ